MLSQSQRDIVKSCVPALQEHGVTLTKNFYGRMFLANPELKHLFNMSHQATGEQPQALAMSVLGYARHIDDISVLGPVLDVVAAKHASIGIRAEHYPIVGRHLLAAIAEVMGDTATVPVLEAWAATYGQLADTLIAAEQALYTHAANAVGGWSGWRPFRVVRIVRESHEITSFYLQPTDGGALPIFEAGQFVSVRTVDAEGMANVRQYSLSDAPGRDYLRLTVKREDSHHSLPAGKVSTVLHEQIQDGALLELSFPQGYFVVDQGKDSPLVLLSGGVGITPMLGIVGHITEQQPQRPIHFAHAARHHEADIMSGWLRGLAARHRQLEVEIYYEQVGATDVLGRDYDHQGRIDAARIAAQAQLSDADYYLCGPRGFIAAQTAALKQAGIAEQRIHAEFFGSALA